MAEEIELKLALTDSASRALLRHPLLASAEKLPTRRLRNIYLDTPGLDLHARGMAVRLRRQGQQWLQTVKCAGTNSEGLSKRPEWEYAYRGTLDFSPIDDPAVREWLARPEISERLEPVFETNFTRRLWRLRNARSESVLLMLDRGTISAGGRTEPILEIELELERGDAGTLSEIANALKPRVALRPESLSKAERGYRLHRPPTEQQETHTMDLILWRHAEAEDGLPDEKRALTPRGEKQARKLAKWLKKRLGNDLKVIVSPAVRCRQTAEALGIPFHTTKMVGTSATAHQVLTAAGWPHGQGTVIVVGHQPTLGRCAAFALTGHEADWPIKKGAVWWLGADGAGGEEPSISLRAVVGPDLA